MTGNLNMITSEQLKQYRVEREWSVRQMAAYLDISKTTYARYESGANEIPEKVQERIHLSFTSFNGTMAIALDYLRISFETLTPEKVISDVLGMNIDDFSTSGGNASMLYKASLNYSGFFYIRVFTRSENVDEIGALLQISGRGCRSMEFLLQKQKRTWVNLLYVATMQYSGKVTRIDMAINDYIQPRGWFNIDTLIKLAMNKDYKSRFRSEPIIHGNQYDGWTLEFGKRGNVFFRFYEKDKEVASKLGTTKSDLGIVNRYELQIGDTRKAMQVVHDWIVSDDLIPTVYGYFNRYITFYAYIDPKIKARDDYVEAEDRPVFQQWHYFVLHAKEIVFETLPEEVSLERSLAWIQRSVAPTLKLLDEAGALSDVMDFMREAELSPKHEKLLEALNRQIDEENMIANEFEKQH